MTDSPRYDKVFYIASVRRRVRITQRQDDRYAYDIRTTTDVDPDPASGEKLIPSQKEFDTVLADLNLIKLSTVRRLVNVLTHAVRVDDAARLFAFGRGVEHTQTHYRLDDPQKRYLQQ